MKKVLLFIALSSLFGCAPKPYEKPEYLTGVLVKSERLNDKPYCYYKIIDLENNLIFSTIPAASTQGCTKRIKINMENDEIIWLK